MNRRVKIAGLALLGLIVLAVVAAFVALLLSVETEARVPSAAAPTPAEVERLRRTFQQNDPRRLEPGEVATLSLDERELAIALGRALAVIGTTEAVTVELRPGRLHLRTTLELPIDLERRFLNLDMAMRQTEGLPRFERLRLGRTPLPAGLADRVWRRLATRWLADQGVTDALEMIRAVAFGDRRLDVTYRWQPWTVERLRDGLIGGIDTHRVELFHRRLVEATHEYHRNAHVPLGELLRPLFELAELRSGQGDPRAENRAAILVLGSYLGRRSLAAWIPEASEWPTPQSLAVTLHGQWDLSTHFVTSAVVASLGGGAFSNAVGLYKELADRGGGSGFSFQDLGADRAGTLFGELAVGSKESAARVQRLLREDASDSALLPRLDDLPDALSSTEFHERFGDVGSPEYERLTAEIEQRIEALPFYRSR